VVDLQLAHPQAEAVEQPGRGHRGLELDLPALRESYVEVVDPRPGGAQLIEFAPVGAKRGFGKSRKLADVPTGDVDPKTLAFDGTTLSWMTKSGQPGSATVPA
jgi:hypothetical protein